MTTSVPPVLPVVHAPHRSSGEVLSTGTAPVPVGQSAPVAAAPQGGSQGATVTASVGAAAPAPAGPPAAVPGGTPTTSTTGRTAGPLDGGLAHTGADVVLVLGFALLAVLLGTLLVRLGSRPVLHVPAEGAP